MNDVVVIDAYLIRSLRVQGKGLEADALVRAHQESLRKNRVVMKNELKNEYQNVRAVLKRRAGLCVECPLQAMDGKHLCRGCFERKRAYAQRKKLGRD